MPISRANTTGCIHSIAAFMWICSSVGQTCTTGRVRFRSGIPALSGSAEKLVMVFRRHVSSISHREFDGTGLLQMNRFLVKFWVEDASCVILSDAYRGDEYTPEGLVVPARFQGRPSAQCLASVFLPEQVLASDPIRKLRSCCCLLVQHEPCDSQRVQTVRDAAIQTCIPCSSSEHAKSPADLARFREELFFISTESHWMNQIGFCFYSINLTVTKGSDHDSFGNSGFCSF